MDHLKQQDNITFCHRLGKSAMEIIWMLHLHAMYVKQMMPWSKVSE